MQYLPGPLLQGLSGYLSSRDLLGARLVCKNWREHLVVRVPVCIVLPLDTNAVECGIPLLHCAPSAVLALDEVHLEKLPSRPDDMQACFSRAADLHRQLELLGRTCKSLRGLRLLFQPAVVQIYNPETEHWLSAACALWLGKVFHGWTSLAPRLRQLHITVGSMQPPCPTTLAHALQQLPCLEDLLLSCKHITADHALAIAQMTGLRALSLHDKHKSSIGAWWAAPGVRTSPPSLQRLTSLVLDSPGLTATEGLPPFINSTGLLRLELLGSPGINSTLGGGSFQDLQNIATTQTPFAALLLSLPNLNTLAINTPTLGHSDWTALSTLCAANRITELRINHWRKPEAGPRGLTAFKMPEVQDGERPEDGKEQGEYNSCPLSPLGLASCLVAKATLLHPAQLPMLLIGSPSQPSSSCRLRELHLAFLETSCTAPDGETDSTAPDSSNSGNLENEEVVRSAWSAIVGCLQLRELNISRTNTLPLTDGVLSQLPGKLPMLEVLQFNGCLVGFDWGERAISTKTSKPLPQSWMIHNQSSAAIFSGPFACWWHIV
ncbi:hypothetical protein DUNSADRAFT_12108 [Dunaliella salina]|uniref:F-box domain-containing protein n=1 Tax=Dunaliella salina TaxID=3046 RepID=A0ABQ7H470_DUNSA|nr:hypothetical protein DUNSADRAFT_12108 [Dunaliella salina]|eukprot:KAF5841652.1 hypothetical protein DUNSADRAFT_12108 [Dunaliella salina]